MSQTDAVDMEEDETPSFSGFFSNRAKFVPTKTAAKLKAASEFVNKLEEEKTKEPCVAKKKVKLKEKNKDAFFPVAKSRTRKSRNISAANTDIVVEDVLNDTFDSPEVTLSVAAKRRLRRLQLESDLELRRVEEENKRILSAVEATDYCDVVEADAEYEFEKVHLLTVSYMSDVSRLKCYENENFGLIFPKVAVLFGLKVTEFLLCHREKTISVEDTPKSLNLSEADTLECIPYKAAEAGPECAGDTLKITFQSNDSKQKIEMSIHRVEKMKDIMGRYASQRSLPISELKFVFDGETLTGSETPEDLDMETGNCIDVTVLNFKVKTPTKRKGIAVHRNENDAESVVTIDSTTNDFVVLDVDSRSSTDVSVLSSNTRTPARRRRGRGSTGRCSRGRGKRYSQPVAASQNESDVSIAESSERTPPKRGRGTGRGRCSRGRGGRGKRNNQQSKTTESGTMESNILIVQSKNCTDVTPSTSRGDFEDNDSDSRDTVIIQLHNIGEVTVNTSSEKSPTSLQRRRDQISIEEVVNSESDSDIFICE